MANLEFQMRMDDPVQEQKPPTQGQEPSTGTLQGYLKRSAHPIALIFHYIFKLLGLFSYFFLGLITDNTTLIFIIMVLFSAFDFWTVQNITGRLLVGLRWRNRIKQDGTQEWIFQSLNENTQSNKGDLWGFWLGLILMPVIWAVLLLANILTLNLLWSMLMLVCLVMSGVNLVGYYKCSKDHKQKLKELFKQGAFQAAVRGIQVKKQMASISSVSHGHTENGVQFFIDTSRNKKSHKKDKICQVCFESFSLIGSNQKKYCKFCFRGVHTKCATRSAHQSLLGRVCRLCNNCYQRGMEASIKQGFQNQLVNAMNDVETHQEVLRTQREANIQMQTKKSQLLQELERKKEMILKRDTDLQNKIQDLKASISQLDDQGNLFARKIQQMKYKAKRKETRYKTVKLQLEQLMQQQVNDLNKVEQLKQTIQRQNQENRQLSEQLVSIQDKKVDYSDLQGVNFNQSIQKITESIRQIKREKKVLDRRRQDLEDQKQMKKSDIDLLSQQVSMKTSFLSEVCSDVDSQTDEKQTLKYLQDTLESQQKQIDKLKKQLQQVKEQQRQESEDYHAQTPATRPCCNCIIL